MVECDCRKRCRRWSGGCVAIPRTRIAGCRGSVRSRLPIRRDSCKVEPIVGDMLTIAAGLQAVCGTYRAFGCDVLRTFARSQIDPRGRDQCGSGAFGHGGRELWVLQCQDVICGGRVVRILVFDCPKCLLLGVHIDLRGAFLMGGNGMLVITATGLVHRRVLGFAALPGRVEGEVTELSGKGLVRFGGSDRDGLGAGCGAPGLQGRKGHRTASISIRVFPWIEVWALQFPLPGSTRTSTRRRST